MSASNCRSPTNAGKSCFSSCGLVGKYVDIYEFANGRLDVRWRACSLPYTVFDKEQRVTHATVTENKRLGEVLTWIKAQQDEARPPPKIKTNSGAERLQEARGEAGPKDGFYQRPCCHRAARAGTGKVGRCRVKKELKPGEPGWIAPDRAAQPRPAYARSGAYVRARKRVTAAFMTCCALPFETATRHFYFAEPTH